MKTFRPALVVACAFVVMSLQSVQANQPHMQNALAHLREARAELQKAERNKGGHRTRAVEIINKAIAEVEAGIAYAR